MNYDVWILIEATVIIIGGAALGFYFLRRQRLLLDHEYAKARRLQRQVEELQTRLSSRKRSKSSRNLQGLKKLRSDVGVARDRLQQMQDGLEAVPLDAGRDKAVEMIETLDRQLQATQTLLDQALHEPAPKAGQTTQARDSD